jgi:hypothetical protein
MPPLSRSKTAARPPTSPGESARATRNLLFAVPGEHFLLVPSRGDPFATYLRGMEDILGLRSTALEQARLQRCPHLPRAQGEALLIRQGYLSINDDHVEPFRALLRDPATYRRPAYLQLANQLLLRLGPVEVAGRTYNNYEALEQALHRADNSEALRRQLEAALQAVREGLARKVYGNGVTTQHLTRFFQFRQQIASHNLHLSPARLQQWLFPEMLMVARHGGGLAGSLGAARVAGARGAAGGAVVSIVLEGSQLFYGLQLGLFAVTWLLAFMITYAIRFYLISGDTQRCP